MAIYQGDTKVSGNAKISSLPLFTTQWQDHITNDASWLRSETFSWQSGSIYTSAYAHLVADVSGITAETETVAGTTITFKRATDGHKIVDDTQVSNVEAIYNATGVAWYYVLDTANQRFKLPRSSHGDIVEKYQNGTEWYRVWSDGWCEQGGQVSVGSAVWLRVTFLKPFANTNYNIQASYLTTTGTFVNSAIGVIKYANTYADMSVYGSGFDASWRACGYVSNPPENAQYKYLYFYVGNTIQDQTTVDVGEITEDLNGKADIDLGNLSNAGKIVGSGLGLPSVSYDDLTLGTTGTSYEAPANGWFVISKEITGPQVVLLSVTETGYTSEAGATTNSLVVSAQAPVLKGQHIVINYNAAGATRCFRFIYSEGSKSLA